MRHPLPVALPTSCTYSIQKRSTMQSRRAVYQLPICRDVERRTPRKSNSRNNARGGSLNVLSQRNTVYISKPQSQPNLVYKIFTYTHHIYSLYKYALRTYLRSRVGTKLIVRRAYTRLLYCQVLVQYQRRRPRPKANTRRASEPCQLYVRTLFHFKETQVLAKIGRNLFKNEQLTSRQDGTAYRPRRCDPTTILPE